MKRPLIAVTQRVSLVPEYAERRDALDQRWTAFLAEAGYLPLILPNQTQVALDLLNALKPQGLLLTGGNSLSQYGGDAPERDACEQMLLKSALDQDLPVIGVCRGMQVLLDHFGQAFEPVSGHVTANQTIQYLEQSIEVNSYHNWGCKQVPKAFTIQAKSVDGVIKAVRHQQLALLGLMWHPERLSPFAARDLELFQQFFG